jgi:hypothetical protein
MFALSNPAHGQPLRLSKYLFTLGIVMTVLSLIVQARVYASFGTGFEVLLYVFFGLTLAVCTITLPSLGVIFWYADKVFIALLLATLALACLGLSFVSHIGFGALANAATETERSATLTTELTAQITATQAQLAAIDARIAACPAGFAQNCIEPAQADRTPIAAKLDGLQAQKLTTVPNAEHPLFIALDKLRSGKAGSKELFMAFSSLVFELLAGLVLMISGYFKTQENGNNSVPQTPQAEPLTLPTNSTPNTNNPPPALGMNKDGSVSGLGAYNVNYTPKVAAKVGVRGAEKKSAQATEIGHCANCEKEYPLTRFERKYCSKTCKSEHYNAARRTPAQLH